MKVACVGHRSAPKRILEIVEQLWINLVNSNHELISGNASWIDQSFVNWANTINPTKVHLYLPYSQYNHSNIKKWNNIYISNDQQIQESLKILRQVLPKGYILNSRNIDMHIRNVLLIQNSDIVYVYWDGRQYGWTYIDILIAKYLKKNIIYLKE